MYVVLAHMIVNNTQNQYIPSIHVDCHLVDCMGCTEHLRVKTSFSLKKGVKITYHTHTHIVSIISNVTKAPTKKWQEHVGKSPLNHVSFLGDPTLRTTLEYGITGNEIIESHQVFPYKN